ncbi:MAG: hypothetical protein ACJASR_002144, partial [Psychroserpens sp.]
MELIFVRGEVITITESLSIGLSGRCDQRGFY